MALKTMYRYTKNLTIDVEEQNYACSRNQDYGTYSHFLFRYEFTLIFIAANVSILAK